MQQLETKSILFDDLVKTRLRKGIQHRKTRLEGVYSIAKPDQEYTASQNQMRRVYSITKPDQKGYTASQNQIRRGVQNVSKPDQEYTISQNQIRSIQHHKNQFRRGIQRLKTRLEGVYKNRIYLLPDKLNHSLRSLQSILSSNSNLQLAY